MSKRLIANIFNEKSFDVVMLRLFNTINFQCNNGTNEIKITNNIKNIFFNSILFIKKIVKIEIIKPKDKIQL